MITIKAMIEKTETAYAFDSYQSWGGAIRVLRRKGLNDREVEAFLRSKHMRWAGDMDEKRRYGYYNGNTVAEYLAKNAWAVEQKELDELVAGTDFND